MRTQYLTSLPFELAYLALLTRHNIKRLSRWEAGLSDRETSILEAQGLHVLPIERRTLMGRKVPETVFSAHREPVEIYASRFGQKNLSSSRDDTRVEGFLFGYPSCCVEEYIRQPYVRNDIRPEDQRILFHWACPGCKVTPLLLREYRSVYRDCVRMFAGAQPSSSIDESCAGWRGLGDIVPAVLAFQRKAVPVAACLSALLIAPGMVKADDPHWTPVGNDEDLDYLKYHEEIVKGYDWLSANTVCDSLPDGVVLAQRIAALIEALPDSQQADQPYKLLEIQYGTELCDVCGEVVNMGSVHIFNPLRGIFVQIPFIGIHFLEHGSLEYLGTVHDGRVDVSAVKRVLLCLDESHHVRFYDNDMDGLDDEEELFIGTNPVIPDTDGDGVKDGAQYLEDIMDSLATIPRQVCTDRPYMLEWQMDGVDVCSVCGSVVNMGHVEVVNPVEGITLEIPYMGLHWMAEGSPLYDGSANTGSIPATVLHAILNGDGSSHWLEAPGDTDGDGLTDSEEAYFGTDAGAYDTDGDGIPDGVEIAKAMHAIIDAIPVGARPDSLYRVDHLFKGVYQCMICGKHSNMGWTQIFNPQNGRDVIVPFQTLHFMSKGSFETDIPSIFPRVDPCGIDSVIGPLTNVAGDVRPTFPFQVFPNPFRHKTRIVLSLPSGAKADVAVYDILGRKVLDLASGEGPTAEFTWDGTNSDGNTLPPGIYFVRFRSGDLTFTRKVMFLK
jgi:hypothetical protein